MSHPSGPRHVLFGREPDLDRRRRRSSNKGVTDWNTDEGRLELAEKLEKELKQTATLRLFSGLSAGVSDSLIGK